MISSDLPEPVVPAISPWGPCPFSCTSSAQSCPSPSMPSGAESAETVVFLRQRVAMFNASGFAASNSCKKGTVSGMRRAA